MNGRPARRPACRTHSPHIERSVYAAVAATLGTGCDELARDDALFVDLGADWLDLADIVLRIERASGIRLRSEALTTHLTGTGGFVSTAEMRSLQGLIPQIEIAALRGTLRANHALARFTVGDLVELVARQAMLLAA